MASTNNAIRKQNVIGAANAIVQALQQHDLQCVFVGTMATYLNGIGKPPPKLEAVVFPATSTNPPKQPPNVITLLCEHDPTHYERKSKKSLAYYDRSGTIPDGKRDWCDVSVTTFRRAPPQYQPSHLDQRQGLPTLTLLALISNHVQAILQRQEQSTRSRNPWPGQRDIRHLDAMLRLADQRLPVQVADALSKSAVADFEKFSAALPEYAPRLGPLIQVCQGADAVGAIPEPVASTSEPAMTPAHQEVTSSVTATNALSRSARKRTRKARQTDSQASGPTQNQTKTTAQSPTPTPTEILFDIAKQVVQVLKEAGIDCALFGSLGTSLYGKQRSPNDIDMLTFPPTDPDPERIKQLIVDAQPERFYLRDSVNPEATYKILFYRLKRRENPTRFFRRNSCKVDILVPDIMHLPSLPPSRVTWIDGLPVLPFSVLLTQKLQAWDDHRNMEDEPRKYNKRLVDKNDLGRMFKMEEHVAPLRVAEPRPWMDRVLFNEEFEGLSRTRAAAFCQIFPEFKERFTSVGLLDVLIV